MVQATKKIALLHRYSKDEIEQTNAAYPYLVKKGIKTLCFKKFNRKNNVSKFLKSLLWIFYAPMLVAFKKYDVIYCDDSFPFYPALVKLISPASRVAIRLGDLHLMYYSSGRLYNFLHYFEKIGWRMADEIIVISKAMQTKLVSEGFESKVVLDPIEPSKFMPKKEIKSQDKIIMFHGLVTANKGIDMMIEAAKYMPKVYFWVVGDGPDVTRLKRIAPDNVVFTGWHPFEVMADMLNYCDIGLSLRDMSCEGNEYVVTSAFLQYASVGKPCLVNRRKVFGDYEWQFKGIDEMVAHITELLNRPNEGTKLRNRIIKQHNAKKIGYQIWSLLSY